MLECPDSDDFVICSVYVRSVTHALIHALFMPISEDVSLFAAFNPLTRFAAVSDLILNHDSQVAVNHH